MTVINPKIKKSEHAGHPKIQFGVMKSLFFEHFYDLTGPKYAEKYEDSESGLKSTHFLAKMISFC